jgi:imidazoleglycerol phosphate dehydratase HisB
MSEILYSLESVTTNLREATHVKVLARADNNHKTEAAFKALCIAVHRAPNVTAIP